MTEVTTTIYDRKTANVSDGLQLTASNGKMSGYGGTPVTIPSSANQAIVTEGGASNFGCTDIASLQSLAIANKTLINQLRNDLVSLVFINGAA